ncbi:MAG: Xaa-Pro peptidase family protein [Actinobacteria bacterium]|nr:Xaa-Pro peptidase family protein [Actinomycetota bacterium]
MTLRQLAALDYASRAPQLQRSLREASIEALLVTSLTNIRWLTGFTGSSAWLLVTHDEMLLVTDGRYGDQASAQLNDAGVHAGVGIGQTKAAQIAHVAQAFGSRTVLGFEGAHISYAEHASLSSKLEASWTPTEGLVETHRRTKDQGELDRMARAGAIADDALAATLPLLAHEPTEVELRDALEAAMRQLGAEAPSFDTIIAAGANATMPHHRPDQTRIIEGMTVVIDFGALFDGYHSDMTRTFTMGDPTPMQDEVFQVVLQAQCAGVAAVAAGASGRGIDDLCRAAIAGAGWGDWFTHGTGHGVGLQIHESPWLTQSFDDTLQVADVVTVEPGVYRRDFGGVRIEDMVVVATHGCEPLTKTPKDSPCLPLQPTN